MKKSNKKSVYIYLHDLQNKRVLTQEGCFGFHRTVNVKDGRLYYMRECKSLKSHMFAASFETQSVHIIGWVMGGHVVCCL